jgi:hypothetical protein
MDGFEGTPTVKTALLLSPLLFQRPGEIRAMARTLLDETLGYRVDWIEHQLAHAVRDANGRAYNRTSHIEGRRTMMQGWADYLDVLRVLAKGGNVVVGESRT